MTDPFLRAFQVAHNCFDLSGIYAPASIRDQMLRGFFLVQRLFEEGVLAPGKRLLVVGAGAAGATAGIQAARSGAAALIIEKTARPFPLQREVSFRWIDPTQYDWPLAHWRRGVFPWRAHPKMPLYWQAAIATDIAQGWTEQLKSEQIRLGPLLQTQYKTTFQRLMSVDRIASTKQVVAELSTNSGSEKLAFDAAIFCHGFGEEKTRMADFVGAPFWAAGAKDSRWSGPTILVSGSGDGALQDFLLATTGRSSAREIFEAVIPDSLRSSVENEIHDAEDQAQRAIIWRTTARHDHAIYDSVERVHETMVRNVLRDAPEVKVNLDGLVDSSRMVNIVHPCSHFGRAYALNRFLSLLLIRYLEEKRLMVHQPETAISNVTTADSKTHQCDPQKPEDCQGHAHFVWFARMRCYDEEPGPSIGWQPFDHTILRHGVHAPVEIHAMKSSGEETVLERPAQTQQILPYHAF